MDGGNQPLVFAFLFFFSGAGIGLVPKARTSESGGFGLGLVMVMMRVVLGEASGSLGQSRIPVGVLCWLESASSPSLAVGGTV